jgi:catechol 1,2-dioxygenase
MRDEEGLTYDDFSVATDLLQRVQQNTGAPLAMVFGPLYSEVFLDGRDSFTPAAGVDAFTVIYCTPHIGNPGTLPMRPDEPGTPLSVSGRVPDGHGRPLECAKLEIFHAADNGNCSGLYDDGVPKYNLRGHLFTDACSLTPRAATSSPSSPRRPTPTPTSRRSAGPPRPARPSGAASTARRTSTTRSTTPG